MGIRVRACVHGKCTRKDHESLSYATHEVIVHAIQTPEEAHLTNGASSLAASQAHLQQLMRRVFERPDEARRRGAAARERMRERYSPERLATEVLTLAEDVRILPRRRRGANKLEL